VGSSPAPEDLVDDGGQGVGAALRRSTQVILMWWCHRRIEGGQQRGAGFGVQLSA